MAALSQRWIPVVVTGQADRQAALGCKPASSERMTNLKGANQGLNVVRKLILARSLARMILVQLHQELRKTFALLVAQVKLLLLVEDLGPRPNQRLVEVLGDKRDCLQACMRAVSEIGRGNWLHKANRNMAQMCSWRYP